MHVPDMSITISKTVFFSEHAGTISQSTWAWRLPRSATIQRLTPSLWGNFEPGQLKLSKLGSIRVIRTHNNYAHLGIKYRVIF